MTPAHIISQASQRLEALGANLGMATLEGLELVTEGLPDWWADGGNSLLLRPGPNPAPRFSCFLTPAPRNAICILGGAHHPAEVMMGGDSPTIVTGAGSSLLWATMSCIDRSGIIIGDETVGIANILVDARNGGFIEVGRRGRWSLGVTLQTDDMHAIRDKTGRRLNAFGGKIRLGEHVWLTRDVLVQGNSVIGGDSVVGARSMVTGSLPANTLSVGVPARVIREDIVWSDEDLP